MYEIYRKFLNDISHSVKLNYYYRLLGLQHSNMGKFLKGDNSTVKLDKVELLVNFIKNDLSKKIV